MQHHWEILSKVNNDIEIIKSSIPKRLIKNYRVKLSLIHWVGEIIPRFLAQ